MTVNAEDKKRTFDARTAERVDLRRKQIFDAAARVFARKGFHNATVQDVADEAGLGKGTIYEYVQSKRELLFLVIEEGQALLFSAIKDIVESGRSPLEKLRAMLLSALRLIEQHRETARAIVPEMEGMTDDEKERIEALKMNFMGVFLNVLEEGVASGLFRPMNTLVASEILIESVHLWAQSETLARHGGGAEEFERTMSRIFFEGMLKRAPHFEKE